MKNDLHVYRKALSKPNFWAILAFLIGLWIMTILFLTYPLCSRPIDFFSFHEFRVILLGSYEDPFAIIGGVCLSACRVSRGLLGGIQ